MTNKKLHIIFIASFCIALALPALGMIFHLSPDAASFENRLLAAPPTFSLGKNLHDSWNSVKAFPALFDAYIDDNFGFREYLITLEANIDVKLFHVTSNPVVAIGENGWLYLNSADLASPFLKQDAKDTTAIKNMLDTRIAWFHSIGTQYFVAIVPEKQEIYPEYFPGNVQNLYATVGIDWVPDFLQQNYPDNFIDLKAPILDVKDAALGESSIENTTDATESQILALISNFETNYGSATPLFYYKTDSHWNSISALIAYEEMMKKIGEKIEGKDGGVAAYPASSFTLSPQDFDKGDLSLLLGLNKSLDEKNIWVSPVATSSASIAAARNFDDNYANLFDTTIVHYFTCAGCAKKKIVLLGDSQLLHLAPFFALSFSEVTYMPIGMPKDDIYRMIATEKPDVVIEEKTARETGTLFYDLPEDIK